MSTTPQLVFQLRPETYAILTLDSVQSLGAATGNPIVLIDPPIPQPVVDAEQLGNPSDVPSLLSSVRGSRFSRPWLQWFWLLKRFATQPTGSSLIEVLAPSVDETDIGWFGSGTINATDDPATFTATLTNESRWGMVLTITNPGTGYGSAPTLAITDAKGNTNGAAATCTVSGGKITTVTVVHSGYGLVAPITVAITGGGGSGGVISAALGRQWAIGDYIIWNDPTIPAGKNYYSYEIDQITNITFISLTSATFKLARHASGAAAGVAQYGSLLAAHAGSHFYRLINKSWLLNLDLSVGPQLVKLLWDNMTVAAVQLSGQGATPILRNLAPLPYLPGTTTPDPRATPACPGMRTMNGAAYCSLGITGVISVGQTSNARISAQAWESIRTLYAKVLVAPTGATSFGGDANACIVIYVCYIDPSGTVGLLDTLVIDDSAFNSYASSNVPDGRQMPFHALAQWTRTAPLYDWPPNWLPTLAGALDAGGLLQLGTPPAMPNPPSGTTSVQFHPDGAIDFIVAQVGATIAGSGLTVTVQT